MLFKYTAISDTGAKTEGTIDAINADVAITSLQRRGLTISGIHSTDEQKDFWKQDLGFFDRVSNKDIVILSRQMSTLFTSQVSALRIFKLLSSETESRPLRKQLAEISDDIQGGSSISIALSKHPKIFNTFYVNMVKSGEESGKLDQVFQFLADYMDRSYEVSSKVKNALIYPAFVISTFVGVMVLMLTVVIPKISSIIVDSGQPIPIYTAIVIGFSNFLVDYGIFILIVLIIGVYLLYRFSQTPTGKISFARFKIDLPYVGGLYRKLYLSRIADNLDTMLSSGIPMVKTLELTANVVDNNIFETDIREALEAVKGGSALSDAFSKHAEIPGIMVEMMKIGEETGELGSILKSLSRFYQREVTTSVDTIVDLIEPAMIILLGLGVGFLLAAVLIPIYNLSSSL